MPPKKKAAKPTEAAPKPKADPLIKTISEVESMSNKDKEAFRNAGGTAISDPK